MRPVAIILVVVAVIAAGLTAFLAKRWVDAQSSARAVAEAPATAEVLVVTREVPAGAQLQESDLRYEAWPLGAVNNRLMIRKPGEDPKAQFVGMFTRRALAEGEPFAASATFKQDNTGVLAGMLSPGMRAVSIAITNASAVSGFITPGDKVDIVLSADFKKSADQQGKPGTMVRFAAETVLEDVKVLAIDQQMARGRDGAAIQGKTATVEVSPTQAEQLIAVSMLGQLSLVLRSMAKPDPAAQAAQPPRPADDFTADVEASKAMKAMAGPAKPAARQGGGGGEVKVNRAGATSTKSF